MDGQDVALWLDRSRLREKLFTCIAKDECDIVRAAVRLSIGAETVVMDLYVQVRVTGRVPVAQTKHQDGTECQDENCVGKPPQRVHGAYIPQVKLPTNGLPPILSVPTSFLTVRRKLSGSVASAGLLNLRSKTLCFVSNISTLTRCIGREKLCLLPGLVMLRLEMTGWEASPTTISKR